MHIEFIQENCLKENKMELLRVAAYMRQMNYFYGTNPKNPKTHTDSNSFFSQSRSAPVTKTSYKDDRNNICIEEFTLNEKIEEINQTFPPENMLNEIELGFILNCVDKYIYNNKSVSFPIFFHKYDSSLSSNIKHSILLYKDEDKYKILIKPNLHNEDKSNFVIKGGSKIIKTLGIEISFKKNKKLDTIDRVVTHSTTFTNLIENNQINQYLCKNLDLQENDSELLKASGFREISFKYKKHGITQTRVIYVQKYLGESLYNLILNNKLTKPEIKVIATQLIEKFRYGDDGIYDIKLLNTLWDGKNVSYIDYAEKNFTYITKSLLPFVNKDEFFDMCATYPVNIKQQILGLCLVLFILTIDDKQLSIPILQEWFRYDIKDMDQKLKTFSATNPNNELFKILCRAYNEEIDPNKVKEFLQCLINTINPNS